MCDAQHHDSLGIVLDAIDNPIWTTASAKQIPNLTNERLTDPLRRGREVAEYELDYRRDDARRDALEVSICGSSEDHVITHATNSAGAFGNAELAPYLVLIEKPAGRHVFLSLGQRLANAGLRKPIEGLLQ
jgi:hypothetical protein